MADNLKFKRLQLRVTASHPAAPSSGQPLRVGGLTGVALTDEAADGTVIADFEPKVYNLSVKGVDDDGNSAVAAWNELFYVDADIGAGTGFLSKKNSGYFFGYAMEAVGSGQTATIQVVQGRSPGPGELDIPEVIGTTELEDSAVTTAKLAADAVDGTKLADDAVDSEHIAAGALDTEHYAADSVDNAALADDAVDTPQIADGAVLFANAAVFISTEQTGNASEQDIAHGLGATPAGVLVVPTEFADTLAVDIAEGTHDGTNVKVTAPTACKYKVLAWA